MPIPTFQNKWLALEFVWEIFVAVLIPVLLFTLLGKWLDTRWQTRPWMTVIGLAISVPFTFYIIVRKVRSFLPHDHDQRPPRS